MGRSWSQFRKVITKKQTIFGYKLPLLVTLNGIILDFILAPAHQSDVTLGGELLVEQCDRIVLGDKGYISADLAHSLSAAKGVVLLTIPRQNQQRQVPPWVARALNAQRQIIETVNGQLTEQFGIARHHAHSFWGLCARLYTKLAAHTLSIYLNRLLGNPNCLQIKQLAFPI